MFLLITFLDERDGLYVIMNDNKVETIIKDDYAEVKYKMYNGNRIFYDFDDELKIQETYDNRIFNCYCKEEVINIRDGNKIAQFVKDNNKAGYESYFKEHYLAQHKTELLDKIVNTFGNMVVKDGRNYIINDLFKVDDKGTSYYKTPLDWKFLCTVAQGNLRKMTVDTPVGVLELDTTCMTILAKIGFFCNPNVSDSVFMNQLPNKIQKLLIEEDKIKGGNI